MFRSSLTKVDTIKPIYVVVATTLLGTNNQRLSHEHPIVETHFHRQFQVSRTFSFRNHVAAHVWPFVFLAQGPQISCLDSSEKEKLFVESCIARVDCCGLVSYCQWQIGEFAK